VFTDADVSSSFREIFRYRKAGRLRVYNLTEIEDGLELWVVVAGKPPRKLAMFTSADEAAVLQGVEQELRDGGWTHI
jgi:hypothetical protein